MTSKRLIAGAVLVGIVTAAPAFAQEARPRRDPGDRNRGGDRTTSRVEQRRESSGGESRSGERRYAAPRHPSGAAYNRQVERQRQEVRQDARRQSQAPRVVEAPRASDSGRRYAAPRQNAAPRRYERPDANVRAYQQAPRTDNRRYESAQRYGNGQRYDNDNRQYYSSRGYSGHKYSSYGYGYNHHYSKPYLYRGYRGAYGYGRRIVYVRPHVVTVVPYRPYYYRPRWGLSVFYGTGGAYPYGYTPSYYYNPVAGRPYGGIRITDAPREAQVFVDGYYVGIVDDFDGAFQHVNLEAGAHRVEIQAPGMDPIGFDVMVQAGRTITLRADAYGYGNGYYGGY